MNIIKLNATSSTNDYLKKISVEKCLENYTSVMAQYQTNGRGQMGSKWKSDSGKNLISSILVDIDGLIISEQFYLSMAVSLAIISAIERKAMRSFTIKWPNDILAVHHKIAGILIENVLQEDEIKYSVVGIGINLNQTYFPGLPNATSLKKCTGREITPEEMLKEILRQLPYYVAYIGDKNFEELRNMYLMKLYKFQRPTMFTSRGVVFIGKIVDVTSVGELVVQLENNQCKNFAMKEINFAK